MEEKILTAEELESMRLKEEYLKLKAKIEEESLDGTSNSTTSRLVMNFTKSNGDTVTFSYNYIKQNASAANIKSLMEGIVANGIIFDKAPAALKSAKIVTTEETAIDIS